MAVLLSTSEHVDEVDIQDLLQEFSSVFPLEKTENGLDDFGPLSRMRAEASAGLLGETSNSFSYGRRQ